MEQAAILEMREAPLVSERVLREREELFEALPQVDVARTRTQLEVFQDSVGDPVIIQRAKAFYKLCDEKEIFIDNNPIVGTLTKFKYGAYLFPEFGSGWMRKVKESIRVPRGSAPVTEEVREWLEKAEAYWRKKNVFSLTREIVLQKLGVDIRVLQKCGVVTEITAAGFIGTIPDYAMVVNEGFDSLLARIEEDKNGLNIGDPEGLQTFSFYQAVALTLRGMIRLAERYADLAEQTALKEGDPLRKIELERIARTCRWVPANPARDFHEAIQSFWFTQLGVWQENPVVLMSPPVQFTKTLHPFYEKDLKAGRLTQEEVIEMIQLYFLKVNHFSMAMAPHGVAYSQSRLGQQLSLGGITASGEDDTNPLDFLVLEAQRRMQMPEPLVNVIYHNKLSDDFLLKCVDLIQTGIGQPAFHNVEKMVARNLCHRNAPISEARNVGVAGCVQSVIPGYSDFFWEGFFNVAKMVELAMHNGKDPLSGIQIGPRTGEAESFDGYEAFLDATYGQLGYFLPLIREISRLAWNVQQREFPVPFASAVTRDCIAKGMDLTAGGARYSVASGTSAVGVVDATNSLAAIRTLVFEDKKLTMSRFKEALHADFKGYEEIQQICFNAPKYGNDDDEVDFIARDLLDRFAEEHEKSPDFLGRTADPEAYSVTSHFAIGRFTGALPNGRHARKPLTDASVSAQPGTDKNGPTALIRSATKVIDNVRFGSNHLNMKFHPSVLKDKDGRRKFLSMLKSYFDLGGYHVQFNCVKSETLKQAQLHPEKFRDLVVRVAGFSAYFVTLDREVQEEIVKRTELMF